MVLCPYMCARFGIVKDTHTLHTRNEEDFTVNYAVRKTQLENKGVWPLRICVSLRRSLNRQNFREQVHLEDLIRGTPFDAVFDNGMELYEIIIIGVAVSLFLTLLTVVLYILCHYTRQKGDYETEEAKRATDFEDNISMAFMYSPDGLPIPQRREWFIWDNEKQKT